MAAIDTRAAEILFELALALEAVKFNISWKADADIEKASEQVCAYLASCVKEEKRATTTRTECTLMLVFGAIFAAFGLVVTIFTLQNNSAPDGGTMALGIFLVVFGLAIFLFGIASFHRLRTLERDNENIRAENAYRNTLINSSQDPELQRLQMECDRVKAYWDNARESVDGPLREIYATGMIPAAYRGNLDAEVFIYQCMVTSDTTLHDAIRTWAYHSARNGSPDGDAHWRPQGHLVQYCRQIFAELHRLEFVTERLSKKCPELLADLSSATSDADLSSLYAQVAMCCALVGTFISVNQFAQELAAD